jgi:hypothetical protein
MLNMASHQENAKQNQDEISHFSYKRYYLKDKNSYWGCTEEKTSYTIDESAKYGKCYVSASEN